MAEDDSYRTILGLRMFVGTPEEAVRLGSQGGLVVVPSAPVLLYMVDDMDTRQALLDAKLAISDSGLMVLTWNRLKGDNIRRVSGLEYIKLLVDQPGFRAPAASFWIMPNEEALEITLRWLEKRGDRVTRDACYLAPMYGKGAIADPELLRLLQVRRPKHIVIAVGGGVQERLGAYLQANLDYIPSIPLHRRGHRLPQRGAGADSDVGRCVEAWLAFSLHRFAAHVHPPLLAGPQARSVDAQISGADAGPAAGGLAAQHALAPGGMAGDDLHRARQQRPSRSWCGHGDAPEGCGSGTTSND